MPPDRRTRSPPRRALSGRFADLRGRLRSPPLTIRACQFGHRLTRPFRGLSGDRSAPFPRRNSSPWRRKIRSTFASRQTRIRGPAVELRPAHRAFLDVRCQRALIELGEVPSKNPRSSEWPGQSLGVLLIVCSRPSTRPRARTARKINWCASWSLAAGPRTSVANLHSGHPTSPEATDQVCCLRRSPTKALRQRSFHEENVGTSRRMTCRCAYGIDSFVAGSGRVPSASFAIAGRVARP